MTDRRCLLALAVCAALALPVSARGELRIPLTIADASGIGFPDGWVTSGVPIPAADTSAAWSLFDGTRELPLQTTLVRGARPNWLLLDFRARIPANGAANVTLVERAPTARPSVALRYAWSAADSTWTVDTGAIRIEIGLAPFDLFRRAWRTPAGATPELLVRAPAAGEPARIRVRTAGAQGQEWSGSMRPERVEWEDRGPLRGTLRVDAAIAGPEGPLLHTTTRFTFLAGQPLVKVAFLLRNSFEGPPRIVKIASATLGAGAAVPGTRTARAGEPIVAAVRSDRDGACVELVPDSVTISTRLSPRRVNVRVPTVAVPGGTGGWVIPDWSYLGSEVWFDFAPAAVAPDSLERRVRNRPFALAPPAWYSELGAFATEHFGTLDDERASYHHWGWRAADPHASDTGPPRPGPEYAPDWSTIDSAEDPESDDLWMLLVMFARSGQRTWLDRADRWERYKAWQQAYRTDDFTYAGDDFWEGPARVARGPARDLPDRAAFGSLDSLLLVNDVAHGRDDSSHSWNGGLVDFYFLTGDRDALAAALDIAERSKRLTDPWTPGAGGDVGGSTRFPARAYLNVLRAWEATGDPAWRASADHIRANFVHSRYWDPRGFWFTPIADIQQVPWPGDAAWVRNHFPGGRSVSPFQLGCAAVSLYRDFVLTGDPELRALLVAMAGFAATSGADSATGFTGDCMVLDFPNPGDVRHLSYAAFRGYPHATAEFFPGSSNSFVDILDIGWRLTGEHRFLERARALWDHADKGPRLGRHAGPAEIGRFENSMTRTGGSELLFPDGGDLTTVQEFFHDAARDSAGAPHNAP